MGAAERVERLRCLLRHQH